MRERGGGVSSEGERGGGVRERGKREKIKIVKLISPPWPPLPPVPVVSTPEKTQHCAKRTGVLVR